jgi:hypothetical protein
VAGGKLALATDSGGGWALAGLVITYTSRQLGGVAILGRGGRLLMEVKSAVPHRTHIPRQVYACSSGLECSRKAPALNRIDTSTTLVIKKISHNIINKYILNFNYIKIFKYNSDVYNKNK